MGAGAGSYEPADLQVVAVEPSSAMIQQRPAGAAPVVQAVAEHLPWSDAAFDATLAILTIHHWHDRVAGLAELRRVARHRVVLLTWDPAGRDAFWLINRYVPEILTLTCRAFHPWQSCRVVWGGSKCDQSPFRTTVRMASWVPSGDARKRISTPTCGAPSQGLRNSLPRSSMLVWRISLRTYAPDNGRSSSAGCVIRPVSISAIG